MFSEKRCDKMNKKLITYVPPDLKFEAERMKVKLKLYETFQEHPVRLQGCINKLKIDIKCYEDSIDILKQHEIALASCL